MILSVCLNPAFQRTLWFSHCHINQVNRAIRKTYSAGGKGVNVARVIHQIGGEGQLLCLGGGGVGQDVEHLLQSENFLFTQIQVGASTRICSTVIDQSKNTQTEIVEESEPVSDGEVDTFLQIYQNKIQQTSMVVLSGTVPPGFSDAIYARCAEIAARFNVPVVVDASRDLLMSTLPMTPLLVKPNYLELAESFDLDGFSFKNLEFAFEKLKQLGAQNILVTHEDQPVWFYSENKIYRLVFPHLKRINPIGSGDAIAAGFAVGCQRNLPVFEAIRLAVACGCANVLTETAGSVRKQDVESIFPLIRMEMVH